MANSKNPLSLAKLAWSQLKTKPSSLVLSRLSAAQSPARTATSTPTTTTATATATATPATITSTTATTAAATATQIATTTMTTVVVDSLRFVDTPLPSPGPLLGKTPLVDYNQQSASRQGSQDAQVVITKMHEDRQFENDAKRPKMSNDSFNFPTLMFASGSSSSHNNNNNNNNTMEPQSSKEERLRRFTSSGGSMIPLSECPELDKSPKIIRTPLLSGGSFQEMSPSKERKLLTTTTSAQHFQFPPINSITAFNPLTLPPMTIEKPSSSSSSSSAGIPYVPGIPGPSSLTPQMNLLPPPPQQLQLPLPGQRQRSPNRKQPSPLLGGALSPFGGVQNVPSEFSRQPPTPAQRNAMQWNKDVAAKKAPFNFLRMADNVKAVAAAAPIITPALATTTTTVQQPLQEVRHFNFDNLQATTSNSINKEPLTPLHIETPNGNAEEMQPQALPAKTKFLRPTSLPLKPGTFTPKRHHGITPTANTLPLISPETPRPSKSCVQLYLNGHAYTYLGLKCSTKMFYCTVNCPQPSYVADMHKLSMYSVWQVCEENQPHPLGFKLKQVMSLYDSRQRMLGNGCSTTSMCGKLSYTQVYSQQTVSTVSTSKPSSSFYQHPLKQLPAPPSITNTASTSPAITSTVGALSEANVAAKAASEDAATAKKLQEGQQLVGGYESHEDYTYIRGRGRGRYVCSECGIRCKKPSMLKKHIRTHTDVRPFTCSLCNFSFKTKGNLTKHMQSKTHFKKCSGGEFLDADVDFDQQSSTSAGGRTSSMAGESDSEDFTDSESSDTDESKSRLKEHEAARCLLSLSMTPPIPQSVSPYSQTQDASQPAPAASPANSIGSTGSQPKRLVCSFTSPKPPFDYQKQEQYYSNPEESKPKGSLASDESAPMDLTKPRPSSSSNSINNSNHQPSSNHHYHHHQAMQDLPKSQAQQIREVIFGTSANESGFMKTLISVSDKVRISAEMEEQVKLNAAENEGEDLLFQTYIKEQALQHAKMKQSQFSRSYQINLTTSSTTSSSSSRPVMSIKELPTIEVNEVKTPDENPPAATPTRAVTPPSSAPAIEAIESEEMETPAEEKKIDEQPVTTTTATTASTITDIPPHNANLPAAVQQPDATDFKGVLTSSSSTVTSTSSGPSTPLTRPVIRSEDKFKTADLPVSSTVSNASAFPQRVVAPPPPPISSDARPTCNICQKTFQRQHQLTLHMNIHYMERKFKCEPCSISFRTQGHLQKHERSEAHKNKVMMTSTFGVPTTSNPRPFECTDCKIAFRIHGHLAKHLRSKTHVQKLECLQKLPFGTYAEIERAGISLTEIDTSDCENSLISLKLLAQKLLEKDPNKLSGYTSPSGMAQDSASEDGFSAANSAAASAIASLDNDSAGNTPQRASSMSEDETVTTQQSLKRRLPATSFSSNGEESDNPQENGGGGNEKRPRSQDLAAATAAASN